MPTCSSTSSRRPGARRHADRDHLRPPSRRGPDGPAPPLLLDPEERLERLEAAGVAVTVVQHFDEALRRTPYDAFVERIRARALLFAAPDDPRCGVRIRAPGTPAALAHSARDGFEVVVIPTFTLDGQDVRSSTIRTAIASGDLSLAARLLGRPVSMTCSIGNVADGWSRLEFACRSPCRPMASIAVTSGARRRHCGSMAARSWLAGSRCPSGG